MFAESMRLSPRWAAEYRGFWDLPEDFDFDVVTPTVVVAARRSPARSTPRTPRRLPRAVRPARRTRGRARGDRRAPRRGDARALLDEKLSRRAVKDIQSWIKDPDRFDKWVAVLQERVDYDDPIVLPYGEGLNIVSAAPTAS